MPGGQLSSAPQPMDEETPLKNQMSAQGGIMVGLPEAFYFAILGLRFADLVNTES
jgi:hypothetical protein